MKIYNCKKFETAKEVITFLNDGLKQNTKVEHIVNRGVEFYVFYSQEEDFEK